MGHSSININNNFTHIYYIYSNSYSYSYSYSSTSMSARAPVALILGAGSNVGNHVGRAFAEKGYKIALAARSAKEEDSTSDKLLIRGDFADPESITSIFTKVKSQLGVPHVVVYNGMYHAFTSIHKLTVNQPLLLASLEQRHLSTFQ